MRWFVKKPAPYYSERGSGFVGRSRGSEFLAELPLHIRAVVRDHPPLPRGVGLVVRVGSQPDVGANLFERDGLRSRRILALLPHRPQRAEDALVQRDPRVELHRRLLGDGAKTDDHRAPDQGLGRGAHRALTIDLKKTHLITVRDRRNIPSESHFRNLL